MTEIARVQWFCMTTAKVRPLRPRAKPAGLQLGRHSKCIHTCSLFHRIFNETTYRLVRSPHLKQARRAIPALATAGSICRDFARGRVSGQTTLTRTFWLCRLAQKNL